MGIAERLQKIIKDSNLNNASFADKIGVQRSSVSHVLVGRNKPSIDFIQKIVAVFPDVDLYWLISGRVKETQAELLNKLPPKTSISRTVERTEIIDKQTDNKPTEHRSIKRIVVFYSDGSYEETKPF